MIVDFPGHPLGESFKIRIFGKPRVFPRSFLASIRARLEGRLAAFSLEAVGEDPKGAMDALEQFLRLPKNRWQARQTIDRNGPTYNGEILLDNGF